MHLRVHVSVLLLLLMSLDSAFSEVKPANDTHHHETKDETGRDLEARKKEEGGMMNRILPFMIIPFMISTAIIPMMLVSLKFMLIKSAFIGKLGLIMLLFTFLRRNSSGEGGVTNHQVNSGEMSMAHYGYNGGEEYGAYVS